MEYTEYLVKTKVELLELTKISTLVITLCEKNDILGKSDISDLEAEARKFDKNYAFWRIIETRKDCWDHLIDIFKYDKQSGVVHLLEQGFRTDGVKTVYNFILNAKPLDVVVKKLELSHGESHQLLGDYQLDPDNIGMALIVNITKFDDEKKNRTGAEQDFKYMKELWKQMGYDVNAYDGKINESDVETITEIFLDVFRKKITPGSCVVFIGSHGRNGFIEMSNGQEIKLYDYFIKKFNDEPILKGKPKLFFVQACQHFPVEKTEQSKVLSELKDTLVCFSTLPGEFANRHERLGSYFVYMLTDVFMRNACEMEVKEMLNEVSQQVSNIQSSETRRQMPYFLPFALRPVYFNLVDKFSGNLTRSQ